MANINTRRGLGLLPFQPRKSRTLDIHQQVNAATAMKKILLATLLSIVMSENILMENYLTMKPKTVWIRGKQFGNKKIKRAALNEISSEVEEFSNYDDERQFPRISKTRFISDSEKLPSQTIMRPPDLALLPQVKLLPSDKSKLDSVKPSVLISIGIQEGENINDNSQKDCSRIKNHRKQNHRWQIQQPFYVEEPRWINIYPDTGSSEHLNNVDPYILSRGKKIWDTEQAKKTVEDYEDFPNNYPSRNKRSSTKSRDRRSVVMSEKSHNNTFNDNQENQKKEMNYYNFLQDTDLNNTMTKNQNKKSYQIDKMSEDRQSEKDVTSFIHNILIEKYQKNKIENVTERSPYKFKFRKQNQISAIDEKIINFVESIKREDIFNHIKNNSKIAEINQNKKFNNRESFFAINMNKRNKRSILLKNKNFSEVYTKYKKIDTSFEKNIKKNEIDMYEQKNNTDKLNDLDMYNDDIFILASIKNLLDNRTKNLNEKDIDHNKPIERPWKIQYYADGEKLESEEEPRNEKNQPEINNTDIKLTDSQLTNKSDSESSKIKNYFNHRKKRACKNCKIELQLQDEWLKDIEREFQDTTSLNRRNKHSDILKDLSLFKSYIISRGKKASHEYENGIYSTSQSRNIEVTNFDDPEALQGILLMEMSRCNNCDMNHLSNKRSSKDRRGLLDEILTAYDPYYVVRGKRINLDKLLTKIRNQKNASLGGEQ
ncbi:MATH and LRR domain-containing protein PFE0570w-like [Cataglyphis hispanica]|uniref:MATH and LRR domain-containing protein PFE0570w-like n=1 Tax=Cataglyphis hispanica TaxID=1086592 RepID=UPI00218040ED|nr:MATH and LRR domain-containing protein PFE0570w-like [Cataglyphis hispanica]